jgi:hypothetical protein
MASLGSRSTISRRGRGRNSENNSICFEGETAQVTNPVAFPPGWALDEPVSNRVDQVKEDYGERGGRGHNGSHRLFFERDDQVNLIAHELLRCGVSGRFVGQVPKVQADVSPIFITKRPQLFAEGRQRRGYVIEADVHEPDSPDLFCLRLDTRRTERETDGKNDREPD